MVFMGISEFLIKGMNVLKELIVHKICVLSVNIYFGKFYMAGALILKRPYVYGDF